MKVLLYAPFPKTRFFGGISKLAQHILNKSEQFESEGIMIESFNSEQTDRHDKTKGKVRIENIINFYKVRKNLLVWLRRENTDIVHVNSSIKLALLKDLMIIRKIKKRKLSHVVLHIHFAEFNKIFIYNPILKCLMRKLINNYVDTIISLSQELKHEMEDSGINIPIRCLYNFHNYQRISIKKGGKKNVLFVGSLDKRKGIHDIIKIASRNREVNFTLCGSFPNITLKKEIEKKVVTQNLTNINIAGYQADNQMMEHYMENEILLLPSYGEGFPMVIPEAMALGCVIISTTVGAIPEIIKEGENGFLFQPGDVMGMSEAINRLMDHKDTMRQIQKNNIEKAKDFTVDTFIRNLIGIYKKTLEEESL